MEQLLVLIRSIFSDTKIYPRLWIGKLSFVAGFYTCHRSPSEDIHTKQLSEIWSRICPRSWFLWYRESVKNHHCILRKKYCKKFNSMKSESLKHLPNSLNKICRRIHAGNLFICLSCLFLECLYKYRKCKKTDTQISQMQLGSAGISFQVIWSWQNRSFTGIRDDRTRI